MRTVRALALAVKHQGVLLDAETAHFRHDILTRFYFLVEELFDVAAVHTDNMVVMRPLVELENRHPVLEMATTDQACGLKLRQHAIDGRQPDVLMRIEEPAVYFLGREVLRAGTFEDFDDFQPWQRDLQSGLAQILTLHVTLPLIADSRTLTVSCPT